MEPVAERLISYAVINTQSNPKSDTCPSTPGQIELARKLLEELIEAGLEDVHLNSDGYVYGTIHANTSKNIPVIGFLAHMDTSPDFTGENVSPSLIRNYDGSAINLNDEEGIFLDPDEFPELLDYRGQDLIVTNGKTLLGADDKAGIAEIMEAILFFKDNPDIKHGTIKIGFTPDEEIGRGADRFPVEAFGADFAYTLDGGPVGELEYENFNAAGAIVKIQGRNVHPGTAKDKMINASQVGIDFHNKLPVFDRPEHTEHRQGFFHLTGFSGNVESARLDYIIRDHDRREFENRKQRLIVAGDLINKKYGKDIIKVEIQDQYYNMKEKIEPVMHIVDLAREAMEIAGIKPVIKAVRGGTDGSKLSFMGLPTPNLFTGGHNFHGKFEFIPVQSMLKSVSLIKEIILLAARKDWESLY
jgi:tripeptide aminopeptidase